AALLPCETGAALALCRVAGRNTELCVTKCAHGVNANGAPDRDVRCEYRDDYERRGDGSKSKGVVWRNTKQQVAEKMRSGKSAGNAEGECGSGQDKCFTEDHARDGAPRSAEGNPNANFLRSTGHGIRDHTENAGPSKGHRHHREQRKQNGSKSRLGGGSMDDVAHFGDIAKR